MAAALPSAAAMTKVQCPEMHAETGAIAKCRRTRTQPGTGRKYPSELTAAGGKRADALVDGMPRARACAVSACRLRPGHREMLTAFVRTAFPGTVPGLRLGSLPGSAQHGCPRRDRKS